MRRIIWVCFFILFFSFNKSPLLAQGGTFHLKGTIKDQQSGLIVLSYANREGVWVKDSFQLQNGHFHFAGTIREPTPGHLRGTVRSQADDDPNAVGFYLEPAAMTMSLRKDHFKQMKMTGSKTQQEYEEIQSAMDSIKGEGDNFFNKLMVVASDFIATHPASYVSAFELLLFMQQLPLDTVNALYHRLTPPVRQSEYGKAIYPRLIQMLGSLPGRPAAGFSVTDINGRPLSLSSFKGRYVLLDFWASWCVPCRTGAPHLRSQYARYHDLGFDIIGIADDDEHPDAWKKAVKKDSVDIWYNVLRGYKKDRGVDDNSPASINDLFGIGVLPSKILIGRDGVIIGRYEGEQEEPVLDSKLAEIFGR